MASAAERDHAALVALLKERSIRFGDFVLASGAHSPYYIDCRPTTMSAPGQVLIGALGFEALARAGWRVGAVGGITMGADPIAYAIAGESMRRGRPIDAFSVRKEAKQHGTGKRIEGNFSPEVPVVVIEDVITTGGSALSAIDAIQGAGGRVTGVLALVDRGAGGRQAIEKSGVEVRVLVAASELGIDAG